MQSTGYAPTDLQSFVDEIAPQRAMRDPLGLVSGYRAYLVFTHLNSKSDRELAKLGLTRAEIPQAAFEAAFDKHR